MRLITKTIIFLLVFAIYSPAYAGLTYKQMQFFTQKCLQCHAQPATGAPIVGVEKDWAAVKSQPMNLTMKNVIEGKEGMPPLGSCSGCNEEDFKALIRFMAGITEPAKGAN